jgi:hypothetical protein
MVQGNADKKTHDHIIVSVDDVLRVNYRIQKKQESQEIPPLHLEMFHYFPEININQVKRSGKNRFDQEIDHNLIAKG